MRGGITASAQTSGSSTSGNGSTITGVDKLVGSAPETLVVTNEDQYTNNDPEHVFLLYNVVQKKFLGNGGHYGTAAALSTTPKFSFLYDNSVEDKGNCYNIRSKQRTSNTTSVKPLESHDYMKYYNLDKYLQNQTTGGNLVYLDRTYNEEYKNSAGSNVASKGWYFEPFIKNGETIGYTIYFQDVSKNSDGTSTIKKKYLYGMGPYCDVADESALSGWRDPKEALENFGYLWRLISLADYQTLYNQSPANLGAPIDGSFLIMDQGFIINNAEYLKSWKTSDGTNIKLGLNKFYINTTNPKSPVTYTYDKASGYDNDKYKYQYDNGKYSCAKITGKNGELYQTISVNKNGWYTFGCNGVSNAGAKLFACIQKSSTDITANGVTVEKKIDKGTYSREDDMLAAGKDFLENNSHYNSVMIYVTGASAESPVYLRFGITTGDGGTTGSAKNGPMRADGTTTTDGTTIVDNFKLYYAGTSTTPDLVLDEDNEDLKYLTETTDDYTNATLHLRRTFSANKWNTIILPVSLSKAQLQSAFGSDMMLAKLNELTKNSIRFLTVDKDNGKGYMLEAYTPYIIKPSNDGPGTTQAYSTTLHVSSGEKWTGSYQGKSGASSTSGTEIKVPENHYVIERVTFKRDDVSTNASTSTWETNKNINVTYSDNTINAKGTLAKTYSTTDGTSKILSGRDNLQGDYFFKNGAIYQVPSNKSYGLKAFRCWFETSKVSTAKVVKVFVDDEEQTTTAVENILNDLQDNESWWANGVYNLQGQRLREGTDTQGLPQGFYIVNGKKTMIR